MNFDYENDNITINKFDLNSMKPNATILIIAKRGSGKTFLCRNLLQQIRDIPGGIIISPTDVISGFYQKFFPSSYIHSKYNKDIMQSILDRQKIASSKFIKKACSFIPEASENAKLALSLLHVKIDKKYDPRAFILMDDCMAGKKDWANDENIRELMFNGRHYYLTLIMTLQQPKGIQPEYRSNFDYVFLLANDSMIERKKLYEAYCSVFKTFNQFEKVFDEITKNYGCLVVCNVAGPNKTISEKIFCYKAPSDEIIERICSDKFHKLHDKLYNPDWNLPKIKSNDIFFIDKKTQKKIHYILNK